MIRVLRHLAWSTLAALALSCLASSQASSQAQYPNQPIRLIVPAAAGGGPDTTARLVGKRLQERLGQSVVIENRPGAGGNIAAAVIMSSPADGYTFLVSDGAVVTINPSLFSKLQYDPRDLLPVALVARAPLFIALHPRVPAASMKEFVELVRARPGQLNYGSSGIGTTHHLTMEAIKSSLQLNIAHIPYKGSGETLPALLGGHIDLALAGYPGLKPLAENARVKLIAQNSPGRVSMAPEVPPVSDVIPGFDLAPVYGFFARAGTPPAVIERIAAEIAAIVNEPDTTRQFTGVLGIEPAAAGPVAFGQALKSETERVETVVRTLGIKAQ